MTRAEKELVLWKLLIVGKNIKDTINVTSLVFFCFFLGPILAPGHLPQMPTPASVAFHKMVDWLLFVSS